jgi:hypothetical protein
MEKVMAGEKAQWPDLLLKLTRMTKLGEFSPNGRFFTLGSS